MKIDKDTQFALGRTLRALDEADGAVDGKIDGQGIAKVAVDGKEVDGDKARSAFETQVAHEAGKAWAFFDKLEAKATKLEARLDGSRVGQSDLGQFVQRALEADPETVHHEASLEVTLDSGETLKLPLDVVHRSVTEFLQKASMTSEIVSLLPVIGTLIAGGTSFLSALASLAARAGGKSELAEALQGMAGKHIILAGAGLVPVMGSAVPVIAAVTDHRDARALNRPHVDAGAVAALAV